VSAPEHAGSDSRGSYAEAVLDELLPNPQPMMPLDLIGEHRVNLRLVGELAPARHRGDDLFEDRAAARRASTSPLLRMTLGAYLRRLRTIASSMVPPVRARTIARRLAQRSGAHASDVYPDDGPIDLQSILDGAAADAPTFARMYGRLRFWGNAVGSTPRMAEEAIRRGVQRVVLALRDGVGAVPPTRTPSS